MIADALSTLPYWLEYLCQFKTYFALFAAAAVVTFIATPLYILAAQRFGWTDRPGGRKRHARVTATMGGLVVFITVFAGAMIAMQADNLVGQKLRESRVYVYSLLACTLCMLLLGIVDDRRAVRPRIKLIVQAVVAIAAVSVGFRVDAITLPWWDSFVLPPFVGIAISFIWIVGITNAINLTDGLDGLAVGICLLASSVNAVVAIWLGNHYMTVMMVLLAGSLLGFLRYNFHPARVFLGDTGSMALGMFLAMASLRSAQKAHTAVLILIPLFALGYPIFDTLLAIARRSLRGQPLFSSDRDHIHHRLIDRGARPSTAAIQIYIASFILCLMCIAAAAANHFILGVGIAFVLAMAVFSARVLGYLEWGGWVARWGGREETRILHAAANLARLKLRRARTDAERAIALGILAREIGCRRIELVRAGAVVADRVIDNAAPAESSVRRVELSVSDALMLRLELVEGTAPDDVRVQLLEEVASTVRDGTT
ncbi:MAG: undecaprenyl/decaprenyl-phosphate alpha-N-acetylglucosaminyl 1-phosphate transferase [Phycisphaerales bacterium]|nr:undecaprenyl/decaprenyl-phosphate alpha-N-acetylglucosaminyl 1-phosphate transferase [Phycisphaerales bacterium]MCB9857721.1 undecaprenyl/decaprenyl-phosphate alpha-N-acetylglucosaminyl 1-phosphate transferase [Phycisphaerales bacterium]MCB9863781.1 undecaprenyl/decaprenyl-phosphate alpha-N-acetylglucosaminyl 1-phosphate transferase [Phycisphaerales bacterium]